jgi:hypothetical protein
MQYTRGFSFKAYTHPAFIPGMTPATPRGLFAVQTVKMI